MEKIMGSMFVTLQTALGQQSTKSLYFLQGIMKMITVNILPQYLNVLKCFRLKNFGELRTLKFSVEFVEIYLQLFGITIYVSEVILCGGLIRLSCSVWSYIFSLQLEYYKSVQCR